MYATRLKKTSTSVDRAVGPRGHPRSGICSRPLQVLQRALGNDAFGVLQAKLMDGAQLPVQTKLIMGQPGDKYEQEADRVADAVMRMGEPRVQRQHQAEEEKEEEVRTKPLAGQIAPLVQSQTELKDEEEKEESLNAKSVPGQTPEVTPALGARINAIRSGGGQPLDTTTRAFMEPRFGYDFSRVRVHTGTRAAESARALNAQAFTVARNVVFGTGHYAPKTQQGKRLMAHELTHVVQQSGEGDYRRNFKQSLTHEKIKQPNCDIQVMESCPLTLSSPRACPFGGACHPCPPRGLAKLAVTQFTHSIQQTHDPTLRITAMDSAAALRRPEDLLRTLERRRNERPSGQIVA